MEKKTIIKRCKTGGTEMVCGVTVEFIGVDRAVISSVDVDG